MNAATPTCEVCGMTYEDRRGRHASHVLSLYGGLTCCDSCWSGNWDGWAPQYEAKLLARLAALGLDTPPRNAKGFLPRN